MKSFFEFLVSAINYYHINGLHLFWDSFEWFCLEISCDAKYFSSLVQGIVIEDWLLLKYTILKSETKSHHHHHVVPLARISLTLSRHFSLSFIASGWSSGLHRLPSHSCCMYVRAGRLAFAWPYLGVYRSTSLMSSSLLLQQCPACLVRLTWIVFVMGGRWPYSWCLVWCCCQDLFNIARSVLV